MYTIEAATSFADKDVGMDHWAGAENLTKRPPLPRLLVILLALFASLIIIFEFSYDLKREVFLQKLVIWLDYGLLATFFFLIGYKVRRNKAPILQQIAAEKAEAAYLLLIVICLIIPRLAAGLVIFRLLVAVFMKGLDTKLGVKILASLSWRPSQTLALSFIALIATGTILLMFPAATIDGKGAPILSALFTMTSASCVAGLAIYDIGVEFTRFGQAVILFGMQAGGLGIMVLSAAFAVLVGGNIPSRRQVGLREVLDISTPEGLRSLIRAVSATTIITELVGAFALFMLWHDYIPRTQDRLWWSIFHAVSAFCNVGLSLSNDSLIPFVNDAGICLVFMMLITLGGVGFFVIADLLNKEVWAIKKPRAIWERLQIQTKVVIVATILLDSLGMMLFLFFEYDGALRGLAADKKILASLFHAISLRSAGFNVVPLANMAAPTIIFSIAFMFIGGSPGSTGGGIKTTTAFVSVMALRAMLRGREEVELFGRRMPSAIVSRSLSIVLVAAMVVGVFLTLLLATQEIAFEKLLFEVVSAFGTVGLTLDTTGALNDVGKFLIILVMYVGRIGPLTLALAIGERKLSQGFRLPKGQIAVG